MPWPLRLVEFKAETNGQTLQVGDCFYYNPPADYETQSDPDLLGWYWPQIYCREEILSAYYKEHNKPKRPPLLVFMPGRCLFCVDSMCWKFGAGSKANYYGGWTVTGEAPLITVSPSIDISGTYHGFIQNGIIGDDVNGQKYDELGRLIRAR